MKSKSNILTENPPFILSIDAIFAEYRMRLGIKPSKLVFLLSPFTIFAEYRMRLGIKLKQARFSALAFHNIISTC